MTFHLLNSSKWHQLLLDVLLNFYPVQTFVHPLNNTLKHISNKCSFHALTENKIDPGVAEISSVQTTVNNHAASKPPKPQYFETSPKFLFLIFFFNNYTPKHSSNISSFHVPKENKIHGGISKHSSVQSSAPRCRQTDRRTHGQTDRRTDGHGSLVL